MPCAALLMMAGIALGFQAPTSAMPMLCVSAALAGLLLLGRRRTRAAGCLLLTFLLGAALGIRTANPTLPPEGDTQVTGVVAGEVDFRAEKGQVRVILRDVTLNGERIASGAYWTFYLKADENIPDFLMPGARISMTAEVYHPQGQHRPLFSQQEKIPPLSTIQPVRLPAVRPVPPAEQAKPLFSSESPAYPSAHGPRR